MLKSANVLRIYPNFSRQVVKNNFTQGLMFPFLESKLDVKIHKNMKMLANECH